MHAPNDHRTTPHPRTRRARRLLAAGLVAAAAVGLAACGSGAAGRSATTSGAAAAPAHAGGAPAASAHVTIKNFAFSPANLTVEPGATITVTNEDSVAHTFTARDGAFDTGDIAPGRTATVTAPSRPGTYPYYCAVHQFMTGTLTVAG